MILFDYDRVLIPNLRGCLSGASRLLNLRGDASRTFLHEISAVSPMESIAKDFTAIDRDIKSAADSASSCQTRPHRLNTLEG